jgi:hypothetical protein
MRRNYFHSKSYLLCEKEKELKFCFPEVVFIVEKLDGAHRRSVHPHLVPVLRSLLLHAL